MPHTLDYQAPTVPWWRQPRTRSRRAVLAAFLIPPAAISVTGLLARIAMHYSHWGLLPLFLLPLVAYGPVCLVLAGWFALGFPKRLIAVRFVTWVVCSAACAWAGLALIDLLPISVGDGP